MATGTVYTGMSVTINDKVYGVNAARTESLTGVTKAFESGTITCADGVGAVLINVHATTKGSNYFVTLKAIQITNHETSGSPAIIGLVSATTAVYVSVPFGQTITLTDGQSLGYATAAVFVSPLLAAVTITGEGNGATADLSIVAFGT